MENIIRLLQEKNEHLEQFHDLNEGELLNFAEGNFDNLEVFYHSRETLLQIIQRIDSSLETHISGEQAEPIPAESKAILKALDSKNELVTRILSQDLQILSFIETAKSSIIKELAQVRTARKAVGGYRSGPPKARIDEKA